MRKIGLSLVLAGILGATNAVAEESGVFVGVQAGYGSLKLKNETKGEYTYNNQTEPIDMPEKSITETGFRYGFVAGYKQFFTPEFGARYYAVVDLGTDYSKETTDLEDYDENGKAIYTKNKNKVSTYSFTANADALYNFLSNDALDFGAFAGLSLGYVHHKIKQANIKPSGFDLGINFGLRANIAANHGVELYSRFAVLQTEKEKRQIEETADERSDIKYTYKLRQPYQVGLRYTFSF